MPRTSPTCRAQFCGPGRGLSAARFTHRAVLASVEAETGRVSFAGLAPGLLVSVEVRWLAGPHAGLAMDVVAAEGARWSSTPR